jgi:hypothetical protein
MSDTYHGPTHGTTVPDFSDEEWQQLRNEDYAAGAAIVILLVSIFCIGVVLYSVVAYTAAVYPASV